MKTVNYLLVVSLFMLAGCSDNINEPGNPQEQIEGTTIYYTTSNGKTIFPDGVEFERFGANLVSDTYEDGQGILVFDNTVSIGRAAFSDSRLTSIEIPSGVTSIGQSAFLDCSTLTHVTIPEGVISIGDWAFEWCEKLSHINIPNSVISIGNMVFFGCESLPITNGVRYAGGCAVGVEDTSLTTYNLKNGTRFIDSHAFSQCKNMRSIVIPNGVISIGSGSFSDCKSLTSIIIPNSVTEIRGNAFGWCTSLTSITIPDNVVLIGDNAFSYCESLKEVNCKPKNPPVGGSGMFDYNASDRIIYVPYESLQLYQLAPYWSHYTYFIEGAYFE